MTSPLFQIVSKEQQQAYGPGKQLPKYSKKKKRLLLKSHILSLHNRTYHSLDKMNHLHLKIYPLKIWRLRSIHKVNLLALRVVYQIQKILEKLHHMSNKTLETKRLDKFKTHRKTMLSSSKTMLSSSKTMQSRSKTRMNNRHILTHHTTIFRHSRNQITLQESQL